MALEGLLWSARQHEYGPRVYVPPRASGRVRVGAWLIALLLTALLLAIDSADRIGQAARALWDIEASNVGDPLPSVRAATAWLADPHVQFYRNFNAKGSSFIYPPFAAIVYLPFHGGDDADLPKSLTWLSRGLWLAATGLALGLADVRAKRSALGVMLLAIALFYPGYRAVELNQASLIVAVGVGAGMLLASRSPALAALPIALAAAFKPQIALLFVFAYWHCRRFAKIGLISLALCVVVSILFAGVSNHIDYVRIVLPEVSTGYAFYPNQSLGAALLRASGSDYYAFTLATPSAAMRALLLGCSALVIGGTCVALRRAAGGADRLPIALAVGWIALTLASPVSWEHHYIPALFALALLVRHAHELPTVSLACAALAYPLLASYLDIPAWHGGWVRIASSSMVLGLFLLLVAFLRSGLLTPKRPT